MNLVKPLSARSRGFTLVEMLVAMVVLSIGMLGIAGLFAVSLHSGSSAIYRMQAVNLAQDIADRILANRRAAAAYEGAGADHGCYGTTGTVCTPGDLAANDILLWQQAITNTFKGGTASGSIDYTAAAIKQQPSTYTITVTWLEQGQAVNESESTQSFTMQVMAPTD